MSQEVPAERKSARANCLSFEMATASRTGTLITDLLITDYFEAPPQNSIRERRLSGLGVTILALRPLRLLRGEERSQQMASGLCLAAFCEV
jgi:hypothetical protein